MDINGGKTFSYLHFQNGLLFLVALANILELLLFLCNISSSFSESDSDPERFVFSLVVTLALCFFKSYLLFGPSFRILVLNFSLRSSLNLLLSARKEF